MKELKLFCEGLLGCFLGVFCVALAFTLAALAAKGLIALSSLL